MQRFYGIPFSAGVSGAKPPETQNDTNVIFEKIFSVLNMYGCHG